MRDVIFVLFVNLVTLALIGVRYLYLKRLHPNKSPWIQPAPFWLDLTLIAVNIAMAAGVLLYVGRIPMCECGFISLWSGDVNSSQNSQQLSDPYSFTHFTHGFIFYGLLWLIGRKLPRGLRAIIAIGLEIGWEVLENTPMIINRYRTETLSLNYYGDSVINSAGDILACLLGFYLAWKLPTKVSIVGIILLEIVLALIIKDSLLLSTLMLVYPIAVIKQWQLGTSPTSF